MPRVCSSAIARISPSLFPARQLLKQSRRLEAEKVNDVLIEGRVVLKLAVLPDDRRAAFIEHARQNDIPAKPTTGAARRPKGEIRRGEFCRIRHFRFR